MENVTVLGEDVTVDDEIYVNGGKVLAAQIHFDIGPRPPDHHVKRSSSGDDLARF